MPTEFQVSGVIKLYGPPVSLYYGLSPENAVAPANMHVECMATEDSVICSIFGNMTIGRAKNTIDDILKTAVLINNIHTKIGDGHG